jgi:hypothetical protein
MITWRETKAGAYVGSIDNVDVAKVWGSGSAWQVYTEPAGEVTPATSLEQARAYAEANSSWHS